MHEKQPIPDKDTATRLGASPVWLWVVILASALIRLRLLDFPLERDEGEYAYGAQLMLRFHELYQLCHTLKLPGTTALYVLIMAVFGQTISGIHAGLLVVNSGTIALVFALARRLLSPHGAVVASASFALLSAGPSVLGFAGHAEQFVLLPALAGLLVLLKALASGAIDDVFRKRAIIGHRLFNEAARPVLHPFRILSACSSFAAG